MSAAGQHREHRFGVVDGLTLYYREYGDGDTATPVLCLPGLTRNSRDFEQLAPALATGRRVLAADLRGRGRSDYDPDWRRYQPSTYAGDTLALLDHAGIGRAVLIGTSLGGLVSMMLAAHHRECVAGVVLNDIGPEIDPAGLSRIRNYTGRLPPVAGWEEAAAQTRLIYGDAWPGLSDEDWQRLARRGYRDLGRGVPELDMDPAIGRAIREAPLELGDPWALFAALRDVPTVLLRGARSDILAAATAEKMQAVKPDLTVVEVPNRGHVPLLDEEQSLAAIRELVERAG
ncbi:MAG: alpha/beta hydrolase [Pseudomonadota bacterium]